MGHHLYFHPSSHQSINYHYNATPRTHLLSAHHGMMHTRPLSIMEDHHHSHHILVSPASASTSATSLAATLTPGTPTALDEQKHTLSLSSINLNLSSSSANQAPGPPSSASESSDNGSLLSSLDDTDDDDFDNDSENDILDYGSELRHQRAKQAARILLSQCLLEVGVCHPAIIHTTLIIAILDHRTTPATTLKTHTPDQED